MKLVAQLSMREHKCGDGGTAHGKINVEMVEQKPSREYWALHLYLSLFKDIKAYFILVKPIDYAYDY